MNRAEKAALEHTGYCRNHSYEDYLKGYRQAEKDLALTWKDIDNIMRLRQEVEHYFVENPRALSYEELSNLLKFTKRVCEEVLKRFYKMKHENITTAENHRAARLLF